MTSQHALIIFAICIIFSIAIYLYVKETKRRKETRRANLRQEKVRYFKYMSWLGIFEHSISKLYSEIATYDDLVRINNEMEKEINKYLNKEEII